MLIRFKGYALKTPKMVEKRAKA